MKNICAVVIFSVLLYACGHVEKPVDLTVKSAATSEMSKYEIGRVTENPLASYVKLPGQLKPFEEVNLYAKVNGFVKEVLVDRGTKVRKGQVLVRLEAPEMESQVQMANSKFVQAQENAVASKEKYRRLNEAAKEPGSVAPLDLDNAMSRMKADDAIVMAERSNVDVMKNYKNYLIITAPFDGVIIQRNISSGALVGPGSKSNDQPMLVLQHLQKLRLEVYIPEAYVDQVDLNRPVSFVFNSMPEKTLEAKISRSANSLTSLRSEAIEIDLQNDKQLLKPGMYAEVKVPLLSETKSLLIPNNSIVRSTERQYVITVKDGKAHLVDVKEGLKAKDSTEVFGGLAGGDEILLHATDEIKEGTPIK
ncbi:efflux transporter periplasmic adaptor subunit [Niastella koreensis]|uniref:Efflux transporter, RND family, MFP subunit n=2 Tax=Niastella koreensis TaxID=354356 RepID=G8TDH6_NIAKG|nr:efflux RND transporter periplasmic adaptor subunit [Niastella koreensis]AEW00426.1 efflux transporter, RND family, MFP subunit [Niastella koreensis GR20-10]OQP52291.1 efflux transporter periplasmic adaptor subunit [Niastella koreensis]